MPKFTFTNYMRTPHLPCQTLACLRMTVLLHGSTQAYGIETFRPLKTEFNAQRLS